MKALYDSVLFPFFIFKKDNKSLKQKQTGNTR